MSARYPDFDGTQFCAEIGWEAYFAESKTHREEQRQAQELCNGCEFIQPCLEYAVHVNVEGTWGGTTLNQRKKIRRARGIVAETLALSDVAIRAQRVKDLTAQGLSAQVISELLGVTKRSVVRSRSGDVA